MIKWAAAEGVSVDEATSAHGWQSGLAGVFSTLESDYSSDFSDARFTGMKSAEIRFSGIVPSGVQNMVTPYQDNGTVTLIPNVGFTRAEVRAAQISMYDAIEKESGVNRVTASFSPTRAAFRIYVEIDDAADEEAVIAKLQIVARNKLSSSTGRTDTSSITILIEDPGVSLGSPETNSAHIGGENLSRVCTTSFVVEDDSGTGAF